MPKRDRWIEIHGAREHNLDNIDVKIPREEMTVVTGLSGSGKSSLAFDTLFAEGQRRFVESLSAYARRFLGQLEKPDVDRLEGLSPTIAIEQKNQSQNPRSTVGTVTEIYDYLRLLFARVGTVYCPECGTEIEATTVDRMVETILDRDEGTRIVIMAPIVRGRKGEYQDELENLNREGFPRVRIDGETVRLDETESVPDLEKEEKHTIEVVVDRVKIKGDDDTRSRITDSVETATELAEGLVTIEDYDDGTQTTMSENFACPDCGFSYSEVEPRVFSFNSPYGACETCDGLGSDMRVDPDLIFDDRQSLNGGALQPFSSSSSTFFQQRIRSLAEEYDIDMDAPIRELSEEEKNVLLYGTEEELEFRFSSQDGQYSFEGEFEGAIPLVWKRYKRSSSKRTRRAMENYMSDFPCPDCEGRRLKPSSLSIRINGQNIAECCEMGLDELREFMEDVELSGLNKRIAQPILREITSRLKFLCDVGLDYMTLARRASSLSGGESQRIRLATQIGSRLVGVTYVLDEPSIGLHARDNQRLIETLKDLRDLGNSIVVVEHDELTIRESDYVIDLGPAAGERGGQVMYQGPAEDVEQAEGLTADYLRGDKTIPLPEERRNPDGEITLEGGRGHNLKDVDVDFPLGVFTCVTGVSGSGKSTLVYETLYKALHRHFYSGTDRPLDFDELTGLDQIDKVVNVDQSPIGRTPRSNPATYTDLFTPIRELFASLPEAEVRGYEKGRFSFNVKGGRCENCGGAGREQIEMHFLPDVYVDCEECDGKRYNDETLQVRYKGKSIADVLDMRVSEALEFFSDHRPIERRLKTLNDVGLGYIKLGQPATTLSGGEAQRVKLASELSKVQTGDTFYVLDEPTTGLHKEDIRKLLNVLHMLVDQGNTVVVIEHNLEVIKNADWIVDLGPEGGDGGGEVVFNGSIGDITDCEESITGEYVEPLLEEDKPEVVGDV